MLGLFLITWALPPSNSEKEGRNEKERISRGKNESMGELTTGDGDVIR